MARYIDADKLLVAIKSRHTVRHFTPTKEDLQLIDIFEIIDTLPTADVEKVKHGKWKIKQDEYDCEYMKCSCCKEEFYPFDADTVDTTPNYCMNCGAKMDGGKR